MHSDRLGELLSLAFVVLGVLLAMIALITFAAVLARIPEEWLIGRLFVIGGTPF